LRGLLIAKLDAMTPAMADTVYAITIAVAEPEN
jgi:hypothetical protein